MNLAKTPRQSTKWDDMTPRQKTVFLMKLTVCIISFGFIYPGVMDS